MQTKTCPKCSNALTVDMFYSYFSKVRQKTRISNYCKECSKKFGNERAKAHYKANDVAKKEYAKNYRKNNSEKIKVDSCKHKIKSREELKNCYVVGLLADMGKFTRKFLHQNPEIIALKRAQILLNRKLKNINSNGKK